MINAEYSPVIGCETRTFVWSQSKSPGYGILPANHSAVFDPDHQTTEFPQTTKRQCKLQWLPPPTVVPSLIEGLRVVQGLRVVPVFLYRYSVKNSLKRLVVPGLRRGADQTRQ